jgi:hypothetical protein
MADVGVAELPQLARDRGLSRTADLLQSIGPALGEMEPIDPALVGASTRDPSLNLSEMARRGLDPAAAACLTFLDGRLERALLAWDLLSGSLRPTADEDGTARLREEASFAGTVLPAPGSRCVSVKADDLARLVGSPPTGALGALRDSAVRGDLAALVELHSRGSDGRALLQDSHFRDELVGLVRRVDQAHLWMVASAYWRLIDEVVGDRRARALSADTLLDGGAVVEGELEPALAAYRDYRVAVAREDAVAAAQALRSAQKIADSPYGRIVRIDMEALTAPQRMLGEAQEITRTLPQWRFAARVAVRVTLLTGESPLAALDDYLARFGNDDRVWLDIVSRAPDDAKWPADVRSRALREAYALPHDPDAWRALGLVAGEPLASVVDQEVADRLHAQSSMAR